MRERDATPVLMKIDFENNSVTERDFVVYGWK